VKKIVAENNKKKNIKIIATIISLIVAIFLVLTFSLTYFLAKNHYNVHINIDPSVVKTNGQEIHLDGTITNIKRKNIGNTVSLPNTELLLAQGEVYYYNCIIENNGNNDVDFSIILSKNNVKNSVISYSFNNENALYTGDNLEGSLRIGQTCTVNICYEVEENFSNAFINSSVKIVVTKGGEN